MQSTLWWVGLLVAVVLPRVPWRRMWRSSAGPLGLAVMDWLESLELQGLIVEHQWVGLNQWREPTVPWGCQLLVVLVDLEFLELQEVLSIGFPARKFSAVSGVNSMEKHMDIPKKKGPRPMNPNSKAHPILGHRIIIEGLAR